MRTALAVLLAILLLPAVSATASLTSIALNSTGLHTWNGYNLSAYPAGVSESNGANVNLLYDWRLNGSSIALLNMNFDVTNSGGTGKTKDYSTWSNNGTVSGATWGSTNGRNSTGAYSFDGIDDRITVADANELDLSNSFTISLWFKPDQTFDGTADYYQGLLDKGAYSMFLDNSDGKLKLQVDSNAAKSWSALGKGLDNTVNAAVIYNGELYVGGSFTTAGTVSANRTAKWNGSAWSALGSGVDNTVSSMTVHNGDLYVGGSFTTAGGVTVNRVAKWNGSAWSAMGGGMADGAVNTLASYNGNLYAGGTFTTTGSVSLNRTAKWNGTAWNAMGSGAPTGVVYSLVEHKGDLYAIGSFASLNGVTLNRTARWNGSVWSAMGTGVNTGIGTSTWAIYNGELYALGPFTTAGGTTVNRIAKWNGTTWSALGSGLSSYPRGGAAYNGDLYVGGQFATSGTTSLNYTGKWNGSAWSTLGTGMGAYPYGFIVYNGELYLLGSFATTNDGATSLNKSAKWSSGNEKTIVSTTTSWSGWHHATATYNGSVFTLYVDGVSQGTVAGTPTLPNRIRPLLIGTSYGSRAGVGGGSSGTEQFDGVIDDLRIYNRSLNAAEVNALYANKTHILAKQELSPGNVWSVCITPNNGTADGSMVCSNNATIRAACAWTIGDLYLDGAQYCNITSNINVFGNKVFCLGAGLITATANITNFTQLHASNGCGIRAKAGSRISKR